MHVQNKVCAINYGIFWCTSSFGAKTLSVARTWPSADFDTEHLRSSISVLASATLNFVSKSSRRMRVCSRSRNNSHEFSYNWRHAVISSASWMRKFGPSTIFPSGWMASRASAVRHATAYKSCSNDGCDMIKNFTHFTNELAHSMKFNSK